MATKKELVEAQSFSRRRLLTAFVSGAPGGRELEPTSPVRGVVAGVVIAIVVVAGGLGSGLLNRGLPNGWENGQILVVRDNAARYVTFDGELVPVLNMASARLLAPPGAAIHTVGATLVKDIPVLDPAGIVGAPDNLPDPAQLVTDGWLACVAQDGGTATRLLTADDDDATDASTAAGGADGPEAAGPAGAVLVTVGDQLHLVQGGFSHLLPDTPERVGIVRQLGFTQESPRPAREEWLALFTQGAPIEPFVVDGEGGVPAGDLGLVEGVLVGTVVQRAGSDDRYVALADGRIAPLDPFSAAVYAVRGGVDGGDREVVEVSAADLVTVVDAPRADSPVPATWPASIAPVLTDTQAACAELDVDAFAATLVPGEVAASGVVDVASGSGALALFAADPGTTSGPVRFIDENGVAYAIESGPTGSREDALGRLFAADGGTGTVEPITVPYAWGDLFTSGPTLSIDAAQSSRTEVPAPEGEGGTS